MVDSGQVADAGFALGLDGREQPCLSGGQRHLDALRCQPIQPRDYGQQICSKAVRNLGLVGCG
ncbi:hypothetical protein NJB18091_06040 [Mycobacterium marinum]|nr:hypothetical protein NJB1507_23800 [Mycobacterium marinum]GJP27853.1 hypothetical protein NJB18091_06040 [Mycobacterium marinum]